MVKLLAVEGAGEQNLIYDMMSAKNVTTWQIT